MWTAEIYLDLLGTAFAINCTSDAQVEMVRTVLAPFILERRRGVPQRRRFGLVETEGKAQAYRDCRRLGPAADLGRAMTYLVASLNRVAIEEYGGFAVHAGVVTKGGRTVAFPTRSGGGKSTLTAAFLLDGWDYVSDESLCVDLHESLVRSYPKPLSLDYRSCELLGVSQASLTVPATRESEGLARPADFNASLAPERLNLTDVVLAEYGERVLHVTEVAASEAMAVLLEYSFNHFKHGEGAFHLTAALASQVRVWRLNYRNPIEAAASFDSPLRG